MAREILFRGKRTDNGEWTYGYFGVTDKGAHYIDSYHVVNDIRSKHHDIVEPATVGQFTGLLDKNGTKVFEGDILKTETGGYGYVVWDDAAFAIKSPGSEAIDWVHSSEYAKCEVVGNIHEEREVENG